MAKERVRFNTPKLQMKAKEHFWVSGLKRTFDLSGLVPLYVYVSQNLETISRNVDLEFDVGIATIVYIVDNENNISLITGWRGER